MSRSMGIGSALAQWIVYTYGAPVLVYATSEADALSQVTGSVSAVRAPRGMGRACL